MSFVAHATRRSRPTWILRACAAEPCCSLSTRASTASPALQSRCIDTSHTRVPVSARACSTQAVSQPHSLLEEAQQQLNERRDYTACAERYIAWLNTIVSQKVQSAAGVSGQAKRIARSLPVEQAQAVTAALVKCMERSRPGPARPALIQVCTGLCDGELAQHGKFESLNYLADCFGWLGAAPPQHVPELWASDLLSQQRYMEALIVVDKFVALGCKPSPGLLRVSLAGSIHAGSPARAVQYWQSMCLDLLKRELSVGPELWALYMQALVSLRQANAAVNCLDAMHAMGQEPDAACFAQAFWAAGLQRKRGERLAFTLLEEVQRRQLTVTGQLSGAMADTAVALQSASLATHVLHVVSSAGPDTHQEHVNAVNSVCQCCAKVLGVKAHKAAAALRATGKDAAVLRTAWQSGASKHAPAKGGHVPASLLAVASELAMQPADIRAVLLGAWAATPTRAMSRLVPSALAGFYAAGFGSASTAVEDIAAIAARARGSSMPEYREAMADAAMSVACAAPMFAAVSGSLHAPDEAAALASASKHAAAAWVAALSVVPASMAAACVEKLQRFQATAHEAGLRTVAVPGASHLTSASELEGAASQPADWHAGALQWKSLAAATRQLAALAPAADGLAQRAELLQSVHHAHWLAQAACVISDGAPCFDLHAAYIQMAAAWRSAEHVLSMTHFVASHFAAQDQMELAGRAWSDALRCLLQTRHAQAAQVAPAMRAAGVPMQGELMRLLGNVSQLLSKELAGNTAAAAAAAAAAPSSGQEADAELGGLADGSTFGLEPMDVATRARAEGPLAGVEGLQMVLKLESGASVVRASHLRAWLANRGHDDSDAPHSVLVHRVRAVAIVSDLLSWRASRSQERSLARSAASAMLEGSVSAEASTATEGFGAAEAAESARQHAQLLAAVAAGADGTPDTVERSAGAARQVMAMLDGHSERGSATHMRALGARSRNLLRLALDPDIASGERGRKGTYEEWKRDDLSALALLKGVPLHDVTKEGLIDALRKQLPELSAEEAVNQRA